MIHAYSNVKRSMSSTKKPSQLRSKKRASLLPMAERMEDHVQERLLRQSHGIVALWQQTTCFLLRLNRSDLAHEFFSVNDDDSNI